MMNSARRASDLTPRATDVPEDVRAELDADERRLHPEPTFGAAIESLPEDVLSERDLEARLASEAARQQLAEGSPPADEERQG
jgi:hypothetical protein